MMPNHLRIFTNSGYVFAFGVFLNVCGGATSASPLSGPKSLIAQANRLANVSPFTIVSRSSPNSISTAPSGAHVILSPVSLVGSGDNESVASALPGLIASRGIRPDGDAYALIYLANPTIVNLKTVKKGQRLMLPKLVNSDNTAITVAGGQDAALDLFPQQRSSLKNAVNQALKSYNRFNVAQLKPGQNLDTAQGESIDINLAFSTLQNGAIDSKSMPVLPPQFALAQQEADTATKVWDGISTTGSVSENDAKILTELAKDSESTVLGFDGAVQGNAQTEPQQPPQDWTVDAQVFPQTKNSESTPSQLKNYFVYWEEDGAYEEDQGSGGSPLGTGSTPDQIGSAPICNLTFWAVSNSDEHKQLGVRKKVPIRSYTDPTVNDVVKLYIPQNQ